MAVTDWYIYREKPLNSEVIFTLYTYTLFYRKKKKKGEKNCLERNAIRFYKK